MKTKIMDHEYWYGGIAHVGHRMPIGQDSDLVLDPDGPDALDQCAPCMFLPQGVICGVRLPLHSGRVTGSFRPKAKKK